MRRREVIALVGASVVWPFAALAQEPGRTYRLGGVSSSPRNAPFIGAMIDELSATRLYRGSEPHSRVAQLRPTH
jgi:hypothetical protein